MPPKSETEKWLEEMRHSSARSEPPKYKRIHAEGRCYLCGRKSSILIRFVNAKNIKSHAYCRNCYESNQIFMVTERGHQKHNHY